jgi:hypothetical protein
LATAATINDAKIEDGFLANVPHYCEIVNVRFCDARPSASGVRREKAALSNG